MPPKNKSQFVHILKAEWPWNNFSKSCEPILKALAILSFETLSKTMGPRQGMSLSENMSE